MDDTRRYERLRERFQNGDISRRNFFGLLGAAGAAYGLQMPFARQAFAQSDVSQVRFDGWGGVVSEAFRKYAFDPYTEKTGVEGCRRDLPAAATSISRCVQAPASPANTTSPIFPGFSITPAIASFGLTSQAELNVANIPNLEYVIPKLVDVFRERRSRTASSPACPTTTGPPGFAYNRKHHLRRRDGGEGREDPHRRGT
jgi:spermidine/putrescine transport system substrate-binding protein